MKRRLILLAAAAAVALAGLIAFSALRSPRIVLTGIVTTDEVIVSPEIQGRIQQLAVKQGDRVRRGQILAVLAPAEWSADFAYYKNLERSTSAQVAQAEADLGFQKELTDEQVKQAEANLASAEALVKQSDADLEIARLNAGRAETLRRQETNSVQDYDQARTAYESAKARAASVRKQASAAEAAVDIAKAGTAQVASRGAALAAARDLLAAASAQKDKAEVRYQYTEIHAPADGIVDVRAALEGEVLNPGQAIVTLIDPNNLWIRADVEESYIDRIHLGDRLAVRLPSGAEREGTVFFRGVDADYATQRDVSRTKRDIKTFEVRLRCDNADQALAVGMTAFVVLPIAR
jgi:multidrug resistance efflux pump